MNGRENMLCDQSAARLSSCPELRKFLSNARFWRSKLPHNIKPIPFKPARLIGLSEQLLASHYENNYGGAVRRLNAIETRLTGLDWSTTLGFETNSLKREQLIAANSMVLHEVYFDSLGGADGIGSPTVDPSGPLAEAIVRDFRSIGGWREEFAAIGKALAGGSGWVILSWSPRQGGTGQPLGR